MASSQKINLFLRLILKISTIAAMGFWGWNTSFELIPPIAVTISIVVLALLAWGIFTTKDDPFRSSKPVIEINGVFRLIFELVYFGFGVYCLYSVGLDRLSWIMSNLILLHLAFSHQRIIKLLKT